MNSTETQTVQTVAKDQAIEDVVRESLVDQYELQFRKRWGIAALGIVLLLLIMAVL